MHFFLFLPPPEEQTVGGEKPLLHWNAAIFFFFVFPQERRRCAGVVHGCHGCFLHGGNGNENGNVCLFVCYWLEAGGEKEIVGKQSF